jgi:hypothetical protein
MDMVKEAYTWLGTPHRNFAKIKGVGVDCGMLLIGVLEGAGKVKKDTIEIQPYSNEWHLHHSDEWFKGYVAKYCDEISPADIQPGDFILYQFGRCCSHGAVYVGNNMIIHAVVEQGVILSRMDDVMLFDAHGKTRLRYVYRFRGNK